MASFPESGMPLVQQILETSLSCDDLGRLRERLAARHVAIERGDLAVRRHQHLSA